MNGPIFLRGVVQENGQVQENEVMYTNIFDKFYGHIFSEDS